MSIPKPQPESLDSVLRRHNETSIELTNVAGEESTVYLLVGDETKHILRVNRSRLGFDKDAFAHQHFHSATLPIPEVVEIGELDGGNFFCITTYASGATLQNLSEEQLEHTLQPVEDTLRSIGGSDVAATQRYGFLDSHGMGSHAHWASFLQSVDSGAWPQMPSAIDTKQLRHAVDKLLRLSEHIPDFRRLIHGDFGSNNVLVDGRSITAVIDWSEAMIGDALYDLANIFFWRTWLRCMDKQARFLEDKRDLDESARSHLLCYQLHIGLREVRESAAKENWTMAAWAMARVNAILAGSRQQD